MLGIEIRQAELRVAHLRWRGQKLVVAATGSAPLPHGSVQAGAVRQPGNVAIALTRLLEGMRINATRAVIGVASEGCLLRNLAIPPVPDQELSMIVAGEVEHYSLVRSRGGIHSFFPLSRPEGADDTQPHPVVVYTAEEDVPWGLRDLADRANLEVQALEPLSLAMLRVVLADADAAKESLLAMVVEEATTDVVFVHKGEIAFCRRIDTGSRSLQRMRDEARIHASVGGDTVEQSVDDIARATENLSLEAQRSVDYLKRLYKDTADISRILVCMPSPEVDDLAEAIHDATGLPVSSVGVPNSLAMENPGNESVRYVGAIGLGMRAFVEHQGIVPPIDLYSKERAEFHLQSKKRNLVGSLVVSGIALALGAAGFMLFSNAANTAEAQLKQDQQRLAAIDAQINDLTMGQKKIAERADAMKATGVPLDRIADAIATSLREGTGMTELSIAGGGASTLKMQSRTEDAMIGMVDQLRDSPYFSNVSLSSYERMTARGMDGFSFSVSAQSASVSQVEKDQR